MFKQVLIDSGAGQAFADVVALSPLPPLAAGFLIAISVRIIQGSATVAMLTAAGLMGPVCRNWRFHHQYSPDDNCYSGRRCGHVSRERYGVLDRKRYFDISVKDTFVSWTCIHPNRFIGLFPSNAWFICLMSQAAQTHLNRFCGNRFQAFAAQMALRFTI